MIETVYIAIMIMAGLTLITSEVLQYRAFNNTTIQQSKSSASLKKNS